MILEIVDHDCTLADAPSNDFVPAQWWRQPSSSVSPSSAFLLNFFHLLFTRLLTRFLDYICLNCSFFQHAKIPPKNVFLLRERSVSNVVMVSRFKWDSACKLSLLWNNWMLAVLISVPLLIQLLATNEKKKTFK